MTQQNKREILVYVGTYTRGESEGIYVYRMDPSTGAWVLASTAGGVSNPSFVALHPQGSYLYSVSEMRESGGRSGGAVSAYAIEPSTGTLTFLNQQSSIGTGPCHVSVDKTGDYVFVANYAGGSVAMLPIREDGRLDPASDFVQHEGSSVNPQRQTAPHAHSINPDPTNRYVFVPDLGLDKVMCYKIDFENGKLVPNDKPWARVAPGMGPRHMAFHPNGKYAYVINEIGSTITAFAYDGANGTLGEIQMISTLPEDFEGTSYCADVHVSSSGKFLYGSNRGHDSIVIFGIDEETGKLAPVGYESTQGEFPRNFALDPSGNFLFAANQNTDNIVAFRVDQQTGKLTPTGQIMEVPMPVCIKMLSIA